MIDVFLVPLGRGRFEAYYEPRDDDSSDEPVDPGGWFSRFRARFAEMVREAEERRHERALHGPDDSPGLLSRLQRRMMSWIAERVAEQRLLWRLRAIDRATLHVPDDVDLSGAERQLRDGLKRDESRHLRLLLLHAVGLVLSVPLTVVPGPNVFGLFFTFTVVSHFLSFRGARRGSSTAIAWRFVPSPALGELHRALSLEPSVRRDRIHAAGEQLRLRRLATFVERMIAAPA